MIVLLVIGVIVAAKAIQSAKETAAAAVPTGPTVSTFPGRSDFPSIVNTTEIQNAPVQLASAFQQYSNIIKRQVEIGSAVTIPGAPVFGGGGSGGGRGSIGCPQKGTDISPLGAPTFDVEEFSAEEWITMEAGEFKLVATPSHSLYTDSGLKTLAAINTLVDKVITTNGERLVTSKFSFRTVQTALRIHVPKSHLYFAAGILSHNKA